MSKRLAKRLPLFAAFLLLIARATPCMYSENVAVTGVPSSPPIRLQQMAHIKVTLDGKPAPGVEIVVWKSAPEEGIAASLISDANGTTALPGLSAGFYFVGPAPAAQPWYGGSFRVCVVPCADDPDDPFETTEFVQDRLDGPLHPIDRNEGALSEIRIELGPPDNSISPSFVRSAEQQPVISRLPVLRGVIEDQSGAAVPGAWIEVFARGSEGKRLVLLSADHAGRFSAGLPGGDYTAVISFPGFRVHAVAFAIDQSASPGELSVVLKVGSTTQAVAASLIGRPPAIPNSEKELRSARHRSP